MQGDYWFRLSGTFGIIGKLYGSVDFAIIKADVSLTVTLSARIVYEAFKDIELSASASVDVPRPMCDWIVVSMPSACAVS